MNAATLSTYPGDNSPAAKPDWPVRVLRLLVIFLPVLITLSYIYSYSLETPWLDDWDLYIVPFQHQAAGNLQWSDISAQHNESRVVFPMAASLILAKITGERLLPIVYLSYACLCGSLFILFLFFRQLHLPGRWSVLWFLPVSLLFLGWRQSEGLLWSTHLLNSMALFFVLSSLYCCTQVSRAPIFLAAAGACACIASFSMASGLFVWFSGAVALAFPAGGKLPIAKVVRRVAVWLTMAAICAGCFFAGYTSYQVSWPTGLHHVIANPGNAFKYALIYLGGPLAATPLIAILAGASLILVGLPVVFIALTRMRTDGFSPALLMSLYVGTALLPLVSGRLGIGVEQSFAPRYVTAASLFPLGIYLCSLGLSKTVPACRYLSAAMLLVLGFGILNSYAFGIVIAPKEWKIRSGCAVAIKEFRTVDRQRFTQCYPDPGVILQRAPAMEQYHLSLFAK